MKFTAPATIITTLLSLSSTTTSAFIVPSGGVARATTLSTSSSSTTTITTELQAASSSTSPDTNSPTIILGTALATAISSALPLAAIAAEQADEEYVYGAVNAPGGIGLAAVLGVLAILTAAVPVILAPGEDAFNEMKSRDEKKWGK